MRNKTAKAAAVVLMGAFCAQGAATPSLEEVERAAWIKKYSYIADEAENAVYRGMVLEQMGAEAPLSSQMPAEGTLGNVEGLYLGVTPEGCQLAAVFPKGGGKVFNFRQCPDGQIYFIGESTEDHAPESIEGVISVAIEMCKAKGKIVASVENYEIVCREQEVNDTGQYEIIVLKDEMFVERRLVK